MLKVTSTVLLRPLCSEGAGFTLSLIGQVSVILWHLITQDDPEVRACRSLVGEIFQSLCVVLPRINALVTRTDLAMSDSIIIQAVYISLGPFFNIDFGVDPKSSKEKTPFAVAALGGSAALRALRLSSLSLIRSVGFLPSFTFFGNPSDE